MDKKTVGILGSNGFVGKILKRWFEEEKKMKVLGYDVQGEVDPLEQVVACEYIFVAINLTDNCVSDDSKAKLEYYFQQMVNGTVVVFKSTFVPGTLDYFQNKYPDLIFVYNPEFLTEMTAWDDFTTPQFQILGMPHQALMKEGLYHELFDMLPDADVKEIISPKDAEILKHSFNSYYALKVIWFNQLFDICKELNADYETVRRLLVQNPWVGDSHSIIWHKGYRGYGGKCLSKDPKALSKVAKFPLIEHIEEYNDKLKNL